MTTFLLVLSALGMGVFSRDLALGTLQKISRYQQTVRLKHWMGQAPRALPFQPFLHFLENHLNLLLLHPRLEAYGLRVNRLLQRMGRGDVRAPSVVGYQVLCALAGLVVFGFLTGQLLFSATAFLLGGVLPLLWLRDKAAAREAKLLRDLPNALEVLSLCSEAGLSFEQALDQYVKTASPTPLREEMAGILEQSRSGSSRKSALEATAARLDLTDFSLFTAGIVQAELFGMGVARTLRRLSITMRDKQSQRAEKAVQEMPVKMLLPLVLCILPVTLLVIFGPVLLQFLR